MTLKAAPAVRKLIQSAFANARQQDTLIQPTDCVVRTIMVDKGMTYQRFMPRAFGRASAIHRESSHVRLELGKVEAKEEVVKQARA
jgi:large subunit ribosomal protein L22